MLRCHAKNRKKEVDKLMRDNPKRKVGKLIKIKGSELVSFFWQLKVIIDNQKKKKIQPKLQQPRKKRMPPPFSRKGLEENPIPKRSKQT